MDKEAEPNSDPVGNISVGDISSSKGIAIGHRASASVTEGILGQDLAKLFQPIQQEVAALPDGPSKAIAQQAVTGLEQEARKGDAAQEQTVSTWFNFLAQAAPDVWDVAVTTLANPVAGAAKVVHLIAQRAKQEKEAKK